VTGPGGTSVIGAADQFTYVTPAAPVVTGLSLTSGSTLGGLDVAIVGTGFTGATGVSFGALAATQFFVLSDTAILARTPAAAPVTVYPVASSTVYRNADGTGAEVTTDAYTYFPGTARAQSLTVTHPAVGAAQNGPGTADQEAHVYDVYGREIWARDGDGFLTYTEHDQGTGAVTKTIKDVDTSRAADFRDLPAGWATPVGGGLHLVTRYEVDAARDGQLLRLARPAGG
jgi:hypothetical protein